ncbi:3-hydroxyanthranilic acid dioxygenase [Tilletiaria anomala UBC 951]|uniref:3-hydroxyanthranilate 3,4-dioxygenase n=1 Tax=Tilletiaria anomala (strain ATCC 24038 / CBS 436.72 / UBC 951) TaxID=1037660 RepID=A0A066WDG7_TILAU|nr:3-hydroxyanthranilic acid dioxygenase [Tilletiaria anomala UBC 951]KDN51967.1 3-hydroxyanthranilic acid dioxygenase [Tilletiaria anomala UBC 951]
MVAPPINFPRWIKENRHKLQPPVGNFCLFQSDDYTVMVVGGPNARSDYHYQPTEEFFYQVEGGMLLKIVEDGKFKDIRIEEGEMFMLPAYTPHSPVRFENTVGLVIERTRPENCPDEMRWYCPNITAHPEPTIIKRSRFQCTDLGSQLKPVIDEWIKDVPGRKCKACGRTAGERELIDASAV